VFEFYPRVGHSSTLCQSW